MFNTYHRVLVIIGVIFYLFSPVFAKYSGGAGTAGNPYQIANPNDLLVLSDTPTDYNKCFILTADINMSGQVFTKAIIAPDISSYDGFQGTAFLGTFNGNGHVISNMTIDANESEYVGLFGYKGQNSIIKNLGIEDVNVIGNECVGGLAGSNLFGSISNCYSTGTIGGNWKVGGLVGSNGSSISNCYSTDTVRGAWSVGGLVGDNGYGSSISNCYSAGTVIGTYVYVGGLAGSNTFASISNCYATGAVSGPQYIGGLLGYSSGSGSSISNCYSTGTVTGTSDYIGGLVGYNSLDCRIFGCFWNIQSSGQTNSSGGRGLTTSQMKSVVYYQNAGWADKGWVIDDGSDYPRLAWENTVGVPIPQPQPISLSGSGTELDPYQVWTTDDFVMLNWHIGILNKYIILMADLDLSGIILYPIGDMGPFTGVFDGNSHIIRNANINNPTGNNIGLFGYIGTGGRIHNLGIEDVNITGNSRVGGLVGYNNSGSISNCYSTGTVKASDVGVGGLVGYNRSGSIVNCYSTSAVNGIDNVGGLIGSNVSGSINNCYSTGDVSGTSRVAGLIGYNGSAGSISDCYSTGTVNGAGDVGGLVGSNGSGSINNCYSTGTVTGSSYDNIGGLVGNNGEGSINDCYSAGAVNGIDYVGGLVGSNGSGSINNCYSIGDVSGTSQIGGLVGCNVGSITNCYSRGAAGGSQYVGGLVGLFDKGVSITNCYSTGAVSGSSQFGGLVGYSYYSTTSNSFWDVNTSGQTTSAGGEGKTTVEMQTLSTFTDAGWDFSYTDGDRADWFMQIDEYPILIWQMPKYSGGTGEPNDPYQIRTVSDWQQLMYEPNDWDKHFILVNDLNLQGITLTPVGISDGFIAVGFAGMFDGNNHVINNVNMYMPDSNYIGLFGVLGSGGQILNLGVENVNINAKSRVGGLVALMGSPGENTVRNCYTTGTVTGYSYVGGLAGNSLGDIIDCYSKCTVTGTNNYIGGLAGRHHGGYAGIIISSYATGTVDGNDYVGGLVGYSYSNSISNCYSTGDVNGNDYVGGLVGRNYSGIITACYAAGTAAGNDYVGGLVGYNYRNSISNCYSTGDVSGTSSVGGLVGYYDKYYPTDNISNCYSTEAVSGILFVGGLVGYSDSNKITIASFWDVNTSGLTDGVGNWDPDPNGVTGLPTSQMQNINTYTSAGWDFSYTDGDEVDWFIQIEEYPILTWQISPADIYTDGRNNFRDFAVFAQYWMRDDCARYNAYCDWADLDFDGYVDVDDLIILMNYWLEEGIYN